MFLQLLLKLLTSEMTKSLIGLAIRKLLEAKDDGVTKDVINVVLDGAVKSKSNNLEFKDIVSIKQLLV